MINFMTVKTLALEKDRYSVSRRKRIVVRMSIYNSIKTPIVNACRPLYNKVPSVSVMSDKVINRVNHIGQKWTSPQQRLITGVTALMTQPFIDYKNKDVDEKPRKASVARTIAKIVVGTATGFAVRYACIKGIKYMSKLPSEVKVSKEFSKKLQTFFTPKDENYLKSEDAREQYRNAMGTILSLLVMLVTNFKVDAPCTKLLANRIIKHQEKQDSLKSKGVSA